MLSSQGKNAPSNPYPHYLVRLATSRFPVPPPFRCRFWSFLLVFAVSSQFWSKTATIEAKSAPFEGVAPGAWWSGGGGLWLEVRSQCRIPPRDTRKMAICRGLASSGHFPLLSAKDRMPQGVERRGSPNIVPVALRSTKPKESTVCSLILP